MNVNSTCRKRHFSGSECAETVRKRQLLEATVSQIDSICHRCSPILDRVISYSNGMERMEDAKIADLKTWSEANCGLCKLFLSICPESESSRRYLLTASSVLAAFQTFRSIPFSSAFNYLKEQKGAFFRLVPEGYSKSHVHDGRGPSHPHHDRWPGYLASCPKDPDSKEQVHVCLVPRQTDYKVLRNWISKCKNWHKACRPAQSSCRPWKLIDCQERTVVPAPPGCSYIALSYVWDKSKARQRPAWSPGSSIAVPLPDVLSKTIEDTMEVTRLLGKRYLWVDQLCIDQQNRERKAAQIKEMHLIYGQAEVTIFATSGKDENFGLPGINGTPRQQQATTLIKGLQLASTLRHPLTAVMNSEWARRGWAYQEAVLSHRRLFFTEEQAYFMCNGMECWESIHVPLLKLHRVSRTRFVGSKMPFQLYATRERRRLPDFMEHVCEYTGRNLSSQEDSFNAFAGIAAEFKSALPPTNNLWGLPVVSGMVLESFTHALTWVHRAEDNPLPIARRGDFPSYSFVGWRGKVTWLTRTVGNGLERFHVIEVKIQISSMNGEHWELDDSSELNLPGGISQPSLKLRIRAWVLRPDIWAKTDFERDYNAKHFEVKMQLPTEDIKCRAEVSGKMTDNNFLEGIEKGELNCLLLGYVDRASTRANPISREYRQTSYCYFLLLVKGPAESAERAGILNFTVSEREAHILKIRKETRWFCFH